jgi:hypothetical protein
MARQELHRHVEISGDERTAAAAEVTSEGPGGTAQAVGIGVLQDVDDQLSLGPEPQFQGAVP